MRKTKVICTIGPASQNEETLTKMMQAGMNVARVNFSHGTHEEQEEKMKLIKKVREKLNLPVAIMLDTKGPEYRIKTFEEKKITLNDGDTFVFTTDDIVGNQERVAVTYKNLVKELNVGDVIMVNNGLVIFKVKELKGNDAICEVVAGGVLSDRRMTSVTQRTNRPITMISPIILPPAKFWWDGILYEGANIPAYLRPKWLLR